MDSVNYAVPKSINGLNLYCYCMNNPIMYVDPSGHSALLIGLLIFIGAMTLGGAIYGGVSANKTGDNVIDGILNGMWNGFIIGGCISLIIGGLALGMASTGGSLLFCYGGSILLNMSEVFTLQSMKSNYEGDSKWERRNDITKSMFKNSFSILAGYLVLA